MRVPSALSRMLAGIRRVSDFIRRAVVVALLFVVYALVVPWYWLWLRVAPPRASGWKARQDPGVGTLDRLRRPF